MAGFLVATWPFFFFGTECPYLFVYRVLTLTCLAVNNRQPVPDMEKANGPSSFSNLGDAAPGCVVVPMEESDPPSSNLQPKKIYSVDGKLEEKKARWMALKNSIIPADDSTAMGLYLQSISLIDFSEPTLQTVADCQKFVSEKGNINQYDKYGFTAVQYAARTGSVTLLRWILSNDGSVTSVHKLMF